MLEIDIIKYFMRSSIVILCLKTSIAMTYVSSFCRTLKFYTSLECDQKTHATAWLSRREPTQQPLTRLSHTEHADYHLHNKYSTFVVGFYYTDYTYTNVRYDACM
jgi:hypothetical protein